MSSKYDSYNNISGEQELFVIVSQSTIPRSFSLQKYRI